MSNELLLRTVEGPVARLTLNDPGRANVLSGAMMAALIEAFAELGADRAVRVIVLGAAGKVFCAGHDLGELRATNDPAAHEALFGRCSELMLTIRACPKPVIAALNGTAAGAGLSLALACDLRIAAAGTQLIVVFVRVGLVPDAGSLFFLTRMLGLSKATELAMSGDPLTVEDAHQLGLIAAVVPPEQLMTAATERARRFNEGPRQTYALIKHGLERALDLDLEQAMELESQLQSVAAETTDAKEAIQAFIEKRKPQFGRSPGLVP